MFSRSPDVLVLRLAVMATIIISVVRICDALVSIYGARNPRILALERRVAGLEGVVERQRQDILALTKEY